MPAAPLNPQALDAAAPRRRRRKHRREPALSRLGPRVLIGLLGLSFLAAALALAWNYPLGAAPAMAGVLLVFLLARYFWPLWPGWMLGLLPCIALAPWTGWLMVEEMDLMVLASLAGGYLAISGPHRHPPPATVPVWRRELRWRLTTLGGMLLFLLVSLIAMLHGVADADSLSSSLFAGYQEAGASLRATKAVIWVALMLPLWQRVSRRMPHALTPALSAGCLLALAAVCLGVLHERWGFSGLTDFSGDYRVVGQFWEMHMGGAALDGMLALLLPFALLFALRERRPLRFSLVVLLLLAGIYAALVTFARGLYLALLVTLPLTLLLWAQQEKRLKLGERDPASSWLPGEVLPEDLRPTLPSIQAALVVMLLLGLGAWAAWLIFPSSRYRGLLALCGAMIALLVQPAAHAGDGRSRAMSAGLGAVLALPMLGLFWLLVISVDKLAYGLYFLAWLAALYLAVQAGRGRRPWNSALGDAVRAGAWYVCLGSCALVAWNWGGTRALESALLPLGLLALAWPLTQGGEIGALMRPLSWRTRLVAMGGYVLIVAGMAVAASSVPMAQRLSAAESDLQGRIQHWSRALSALSAEEGWLFGAGAGRFVSVFALNAPKDEWIGDYRWGGGSTPHVALSAGQHPLDKGELLRLTQRIADAPPSLVLSFKSRSPADVRVVAEVCEKHLLFAQACLRKTLQVGENPDGWREQRLELGGGGELGRGPSGGRSLVFAIAVDTRGGSLLLTDLSLRGSDGRELLKNGGFRQELAHWFPTSEHHYFPWHAENLVVHVLFEQGLVGLLVAGGLYALALGRLLMGSARDHPLAPALAGSLIAFFTVGLFDSLVDTPRLALLVLTLLAVSLGLRAPPPPPVPVAKPLSRASKT